MAQLPLADLRDIVLFRSRAASGATEAGHASAEDDALQLKPFGQRPARLIEPLADAQPPPALVDCHFNSIEPVAGRVVAAAEAVAADGLPVMRAQRHILVDARGGAIADDLVLEHGDELAFGKVVDLAPDHSGAVIAHVRIDARYQRPDSGDVAGHRVPHQKPRLACLRQSTSPG